MANVSANETAVCKENSGGSGLCIVLQRGCVPWELKGEQSYTSGLPRENLR